MLAKAIANRPIGGSVESDFRRRIAYVCRSADAIVTRNLAGGWQDAAFQMAVSAGLRPELGTPCYHVIVSWSPLETPRAEEMIQAADEIAAGLGAQEHQYVIGLHLKGIGHAHLIMNRVHPLLGTVLSRSQDYARLELACRQIERRHGWPPDRGRFRTEISKGVLQLVPPAADHWAAKSEQRMRGLRHDPRAVRGQERRSGLASLRDRLKPEAIARARNVIGNAVGWDSLHQGLRALGLLFARYRSGARIIESISGAFMRACDLGAACALPQLTRRLGPFKTQAARYQGAPPLQSLQPPTLRDQIKAARAQRRLAREAEWRHRADERKDLQDITKGLPGWLRAAFQKAQKRIHAEEIVTFRRDTPLPTLARLAGSAGDKIAPIGGRPYRHVERHRAEILMGKLALHLAPDHTTYRQRWALSAYPSKAGNGGGMRRLSQNAMLMARRNKDGMLVGFDLIHDRYDITTIRNVSGGPLGLASRGPEDASICVIADDLQNGLDLSIKRTDLLVMFAGPGLSATVLRQLQERAEGKSVIIARSPTTHRFADIVHQHIPRAVVFDPPRLDDILHEYLPSEPEIPEQSHDADDTSEFSP